ncbi:MAG: DUF2442 domain-containing protein [Candidatus Competibacteraceae bacterium]
MNSFAHGNHTSDVEVTHISAHGVWLLAHGKELFMSYEDFPWFKDQPVRVIINVEEQSQGHFYWPDIDVDLSEDIINNPSRFPLKSKIK